MREVVLDTETTGLDPKAGHRLIEVGCIELVNRFATGQHFHAFIDPERDVPKEAEAVHGLSSEFVMGKPKFADIVDDLVGFLGDAPLIIHNASFDVGFLNAELERAGRPILTMDRVTDTLMLARRKHPGGPNSLDALCKRYQVDASSRHRHGALVDSELLAAVYVQMIGGQQARLDLAGDERRASVAGRRKKRAAQRPEPLPPRLTPAEIEAHRAFVETLGKGALWGPWLDEPPGES